MKIPQTFLPEKNLEEKTGKLLKGQVKKKKIDKYLIDKDAELLFPNFINYLEGGYETLAVIRENDKEEKWRIFKSIEAKMPDIIGIIQKYADYGSDTSEYGYEVKVLVPVEGRFADLIYRVGYYAYDTNGNTIYYKDQRRHDSEKIPFP